MRWLLIACIGAYRAIPQWLKWRQCLFNESCSTHVLRVTRDLGFLAGCRALAVRRRTCRPLQEVWYDDAGGHWRFMLADGTVADVADLAPSAVQLYTGIVVGGRACEDDSSARTAQPPPAL
ncbi:MAG: membrane protein insertion efficiency factor YidD [Armatimonadetes bacterium]|nr:membrane protein insertion efficiency factor YidD [Armatimonadota bacterium]